MSKTPSVWALARALAAASRHTTAIHVSVEVFLDAAVPHKSAEGRYNHSKERLLGVVEKCEAVER